MEEIHNDTLISNQVLSPRLFAGYLIRLIFGICDLNIGLFSLAIKVFT